MLICVGTEYFCCKWWVKEAQCDIDKGDYTEVCRQACNVCVSQPGEKFNAFKKTCYKNYYENLKLILRNVFEKLEQV